MSYRDKDIAIDLNVKLTAFRKQQQ